MICKSTILIKSDYENQDHDYPTFNKEWDRKETEEKTKKILKKIGSFKTRCMPRINSVYCWCSRELDASGKDGVTKGLLKYCNPLGIKIHSFKKPTEEEYAHDFLWRVHNVVPRKGEMKIFIRSHYEDILVPSVEKFIPAEVIEKRYKVINDFEKLLENNDTSNSEILYECFKRGSERKAYGEDRTEGETLET